MTYKVALVKTVLLFAGVAMTTNGRPHCDETVILMAVDGEEQELVPPGYPQFQPRGLSLCWVLLAPPGYKYVKVRILDSSLRDVSNCDWEQGDHIEVREGGTAHGAVLARWCHERFPEELTSTLHAVLVRMHTNQHNDSYRGFRIKYSGEGPWGTSEDSDGISPVFIPVSIGVTLFVVLIIIFICKLCCCKPDDVVPLSQSEKGKGDGIFRAAARRPTVPVITAVGYTAPKQPLYSFGGLPPNFQHSSSFGPRGHNGPANSRRISEAKGYYDLPPGAADGGY